MIPVKETKPGQFERTGGNSVLTSLDGKVNAPLATILADSWTAEDRAKFGVFMAEPFIEPEGKVRVGQPRYERQGDKVVELFVTEDEPAPEPDPLGEIKAQLDAIKVRIDALEAR